MSKNNMEDVLDVSLDVLSHGSIPVKKHVLKQYNVGMSSVYITTNGEYIIIEPEISEKAREIYENLHRNMFFIIQKEHLITVEDKVKRIKEMITMEAKETASLDIISPEFEKIEYFLKRNLVGYKKLDVLLQDPNLEDIICTGPEKNVAVVHRDFSEFEFLKTNVIFSNENLEDNLRWILQPLRESPNHQNPLIYTSMKEKHRLTIAWGNSVHKIGPTFYIRKFPEVPFTIIDLLKKEMISELMAAWIWVMNDAKAFSIIYGEVGTGKTTIINSLMCLSDPKCHPFTIEDTLELRLPHENTDSYVTRESPNTDDINNDITMIDLVKLALRAKPTYIIIGEVRGPEAKYAFRAGLSGHGGVFSFHAENDEAALSALVSDTHQVSMGQLRFLWYMVNPIKVRTGLKKLKRKIGAITEVYPKNSNSSNRNQISDEVTLERIFQYDRKSDKFKPNTVSQLLKGTKNRRLMDAFHVLGINNPSKDLNERIKILRKCATSKAKSPKEVLDIIATYYSCDSS